MRVNSKKYHKEVVHLITYVVSYKMQRVRTGKIEFRRYFAARLYDILKGSQWK